MIPTRCGKPIWLALSWLMRKRADQKSCRVIIVATKKLYQVLVDDKPLPLAARLCREPLKTAAGTRTDHESAEKLYVMLDHRRAEIREVKEWNS